MPQFQESWITESITFAAVNWAEENGRELAEPDEKTGRNGRTYVSKKALTSSQLRKFFGELRRIESDFGKYREDVPLLKVKLAYAVGRDNGKSKVDTFYKIYSAMEKAYQKQIGKESYQRMVKLIESIVAFHKNSGGE